MTTTVRILGLRAREQVPGTSITLLAPGFRGALSQFAPGVAADLPYDLPFIEAAAGAEVMLAAQLTLSLEARMSQPPLSVRSRSAVVTHPRVIVPKRSGVAYALLQTDETGASSFVMPATRDASEATFPLTIAARGETRRVVRVLMWPIQPVIGPGALAVVARWERLRRPTQFAQRGENGIWKTPDWDELRAGPILLLLHDTFSTPQATFADWIDDESFAPVNGRFGGRCLAFAHPTLATDLEGNLSQLVGPLAQVPGPVDIVAHGRGGLLARAIVADGRLPVRRVCQVGTPNNGTALAQESNLLRFLDGHVAMLARSSSAAARATLEGVLCLMRVVGLGLPARLPGLEALEPGSVTLRSLEARSAVQPLWFTVSARFARTDGHVDADAHDEFNHLPNDLVVPSEGCHAPNAPLSGSLRLGGADVHHHNYFANVHVREKLAAWLS